MVDLYAGYKGFSALLDLGKQFLEVRDTAARQTLVVDFTRQIMEAQAHHALLLERIRDLEEKLMRFENWETEKQRYELQEVGRGFLVYAIKPAMADGEPAHQICANCYQDRHKSLLQKESRNREDFLICQRCHADLPLSGIRR